MIKSIPTPNNAITLEETQLIIEHWQSLLGLTNWRIQISRLPPEGSNSLMECAINRDRRIASIRISEAARHQNREEYVKLLIHELVHPIFDPIREEIDFQLLQSDRKAEYKSRHDREVERAVEHLAQVLYNLSINRPS